MEIILLNDVENVGRRGDILRVRDGYARNFLLPRKLAMASTRANQEFVSEQKERVARRREKEKAEAQKVSERLGHLGSELVEIEARKRVHVAVSRKDDEVRVVAIGEEHHEVEVLSAR